MSTPDDPRQDSRGQPTGRGSEPAKGRARFLIPGGVVAGLVLLFAFILFVSRCGTGGDGGEVYGQGAPASISADAWRPAAA